MATSTATIFGSTGMVGQHILAASLASSTFSAVHTISRRAPNATGAGAAKLHAALEADTAQWAPQLAATTPFPHTVFSAVGTSRAAAGSIANQRTIDHDLNIELARAAKAGGARTFVFVSSVGPPRAIGRWMWYSQMKMGVEDAVRALDFDVAIILRPGAIMDPRERQQFAAQVSHSLIRGVGSISKAWGDSMGQDAIVIGRAAVHAAALAAQGKAPSKFWELGVQDILRLGRDEYEASPGLAEGKLATTTAA